MFEICLSHSNRRLWTFQQVIKQMQYEKEVKQLYGCLSGYKSADYQHKNSRMCRLQLNDELQHERLYVNSQVSSS